MCKTAVLLDKLLYIFFFMLKFSLKSVNKQNDFMFRSNFHLFYHVLADVGNISGLNK